MPHLAQASCFSTLRPKSEDGASNSQFLPSGGGATSVLADCQMWRPLKATGWNMNVPACCELLQITASSVTESSPSPPRGEDRGEGFAWREVFPLATFAPSSGLRPPSPRGGEGEFRGRLLRSSRHRRSRRWNRCRSECRTAGVAFLVCVRQRFQTIDADF